MSGTIDSPFHETAAWLLPITEGSNCNLLLVDENHAIAEDCEMLLKTNANSIHRINIVGSQNSLGTKTEKKELQRIEEENEFFKTITDWMDHCHSLTVLKLKGFLLSKDMLNNLARAMKSSKTLQHISLEETSLGDEGCFNLCSALTSCPTISSISLQGNNLTKHSATAIAALLERQEMVRSMAWWKRSLRNRPVKMESLLGLNRITLNNNPEIGDEGLHLIVDALYDDFWIKAVDMQSCGITNKGASEVVKLLKVNKGIHVFDLRKNEDVSLHLLRFIMQRISQNLGPNISEPIWLSSEKSYQSTNSSKTSVKEEDKENSNNSNYPWTKRKDFQSKSIEIMNTFTRLPSQKRTVSRRSFFLVRQ